MELNNTKVNGDAPPRRKCMTWRKRSRLERYLTVVCIATFVAFISMVAVVIYLDHTYNRSKHPICNTNVCRRRAGRIMSLMDLNVDPCEDFYNFSCGSFEKVVTVPSGVNRYGSFFMAGEFISTLFEEVLETEEKDKPDFIVKLKSLYKACMNFDTETSALIEQILNTSGFHHWPILEHDDYNKVQLVEKAMALVRLINSPGIFYSTQHEKNGTSHKLTLTPGTVHGDIHMFLNDTDETLVRMKEKYRDILTYSFFKAGVKPTYIETEVNELIEFETLYAEILSNLDKEQNRTETTLGVFSEKCKEVRIADVFRYIFEYFEHPDDYSDEIVVTLTNEKYTTELCQLFSRTDKRIIYNYMVWRLLVVELKSYDPYLQEINQDMTDRDRLPPVKSRSCIRYLQYSIFSMGLSYLVIERLDPDKGIEEVKEFGVQIKEVMDHMFSVEGWLDEEGRKLARERLSNISAEIGYSEASMDVTFLEEFFAQINVSENYIENRLSEVRRRLRQHLFNDTYEIQADIKIDYPLEVSAYFLGLYYVIALGVMQPPFYEYGSPKYVSLSVLGTVIGHELSHGFESLDFESEHNKTNSPYSWSDEVIEAFKERKECYVNQYSRYPIDNNGTMVDGNETIGDNIADNSGLIQAFRAYEKYYLSKSEEPWLPGLDYTNEQMFFINFAQTWCEIVKDPVERFRYDAHSPGRYRVIGPLQNFPRFSEVFNCPSGSPMNPEEKCRMWG